MPRKKPRLENLKCSAFEGSCDEAPSRYFIQMPSKGKRVVRRLDASGNQVKMSPLEGRDICNDPDVFMCHICNVFVNKKFAKDHSDSKKHQNYKILTKQIIQNVLKQQNVNIDYNNNVGNEPRDKSSYCGPCSKPVRLSDKLKHRISKEHLKAVENETLLNNFLEMYCDTHPNETETEHNESIVDLDKTFAIKDLDEVDSVAPAVSIEKTNIGKNIEIKNNDTLSNNANQSTLSLTKSRKNDDNNNINETQLSYATNVKSENINKAQIKKEVNLGTPTIADKEVMEFKQYIIDITDKYDVNLRAQFKVDDTLSVIARAPNGNKIKITVDAFHSYTYGASFVNCQLCKQLFDPDTKAKHSATLKHVKYILVPLNNEFCRELNNLWCHNIVHNKMTLIEQRLTPVTSNENVNITANTTKVIESVKVSNKNKKIKHCEVCDLPIHINNLVEHVKGKKHKLNEKKSQKTTPKVETENQGKHKIEPKPTDNEIKMAPKLTNHKTPQLKDMTSNSMDIKIFLQYLRDMVVKFHLNYKLPVVENNSVVMITPRGYKENVTVDTFHSYKQVETGWYCQVCQLPLSGNVDEHSVSRTHVRNITLPVDDNFARRINKAWSHCLVCNLMVLVGYQHALTNPAHKNLNPIHESKTTATNATNLDEDLKTYCDICARSMLKRDFTAHVNGKKHTKNVNNNTTTKEITIKNNETSNTSREEVKSKDSDFEMYLKEVTLKYKLHCKLPSVKDNGVIIVTPSGCTERFSVNSFHSYKLAEEAVFCQMCQLWIRDDVTAHSVDQKHVSLILQPVDDNFARLKNKTWSHCLVCNIMVQNDHNHAASSPNHNKYKKITKSKPSQQPQNIASQIKKPDNKSTMTYCDVCQRSIHTHNFIPHTIGRTHIDNANKREQIKKRNTINAVCYTNKNDNSSNMTNKVDNEIKVNYVQKNVTVKSENTEIEEKVVTVKTNIGKSNINLKDKCIMIIAPNGCDALATEDGFHSYKRIRSFIYCQICSKWMSQEDVAHSVSKSHVKRLMLPIDNEFIRQVNPTWQHCLICNEMIPTDTTHEHSPEITNEHVTSTNYTQIKKTMCYPCFEYIHTCSFSAHIQTQKHLTKLRKSINKNKNSNSKCTSQVVKVENELTDTICNDVTDFQQYFNTIITKYDLKLSPPIVENNYIVIQTPRHKENIDVDSFHSYKRTQMSVFCQICQLSVSENEYGHSVTETHARHVVKPVDDNFARTINQAWRHCVLCNEMIFTGFDHVANNPKHYKFTLPSASRNYITSNKVNTESSNNIKVNKEKIQVATCVSKIDAANENLKSEEKNIDPRAEVSDLNEAPTTLNDKNKTKTNRVFKNNKDKINDLNEVPVSLNDKNSTNTEDTNTVKVHNKILKEDTHILLNNNKIRKTSSGLYHCRLCDIDVKNYLIHINGNLEHIKSKILEEGVNKVELKHYVYKEETLGDTVSAAYKEIYEDLLVDNKLRRMSKAIYSCDACTRWVSGGNEIDHMFSDEHKHLLKLNSK